MSEYLKPCPFCDSRAVHYSFNYRKYTVRCRGCLADCGEHDTPERAAFVWNTRPVEYGKDKEIARLKVELDILRHFCDSILDMAKRNNGVLYFRQDNGTWKIETGKDTDVPANPTDNNVDSHRDNYCKK